jgi:CDP-diacylglycerol--serine O-phosphatidyltransferase
MQAYLHGNLTLAAWMVFLGATFDFFDGFAARLLKVSSPIGKELDSLADCVTFGVLPSAIMFRLLDNLQIHPLLPYLAFLISLCAALRLAKFNVDTRQSEAFIGLPSPANAILIASLPLMNLSENFFTPYFQNIYAFVLFTISSSFLMVSELPLFALKFKEFSFEKNKLKFIFLFVSFLLLLIFQASSMPLVIGLYILVSLLEKKF